MADLKISVDIDARGTKTGAAVAKSEIRGIKDEAQSSGRVIRSVAEQDLGALDKQAARAAEAVKATSGSLGSLAAAAGPIPILMAAIAAAIAAVIVVAISLAKTFAEYTLKVADAAEVNGLAISTMVALRNEADSQGRSINNLDSIVGKFRKTIGEAAAGAEDARAKLKLLGIDGNKAIYNIDGAFKQAVAAIVKLPTGIVQARAAFAAFGEDGYKLIPFFKEFGGDVDAIIRRAEELGLVVGQKDVAAAREFNRSYAEVHKTILGIAYALGSQFLPEINTAFKSFSNWFTHNRDDIKSWAKWVGDLFHDLVVGIKKEINDAKNLYDQLVGEAAQRRIIGNFAPMQTDAQLRDAQDRAFGRGKYAAQVDRLPGQYTTDYTRPGSGGGPPDLAALEALRAKAEELRKQREQAVKSELAAQVQLYSDQISTTNALYDEHFKKIVDGLKTTFDVATFEEAWSQLKAWYVGEVAKLVEPWQQLMTKQGELEKKGVLQMEVIHRDGLARVAEITKSTDDKELQAAKEVTEAKKKYSEEQLKNLKAALDRAFELRKAGNETDIKQIQIDAAQGLATQMQVIERTNISELDSLTFRKKQLDEYLTHVKANSEEEKQVKQAIALVDNEITQQIITNRGRINEENERTFKPYRELLSGLNSQLIELKEQYRTGADVTEVFRVQHELLKDAYKNLTPEQRAAAVAIAAETDAYKEAMKAQEDARKQYEATFNTIRDSLQVLADQGFGAFFKNVLHKFESFLLDMVAQWLTSKFFQLFYKGGNTQTAQQNGQSGGIFGGILNGIFGQGAGQQQGGGIFSGSQGSGVIFHAAGGSIADHGIGTIAGGNGNQSGGAIQGLMSGALNPATLAATMGASAAVALFIASLSAKSPLKGLAMGGLFGMAMGFWNQSKLRRKEETIRNTGMLDALSSLRTQFDALISDVRTLRVDPASAISQGTALGTQVRSDYLQMANSLTDKKTRNHALADVARIDSLIAEKMAMLREVAEVARAASERDRRLLPEFANGVYMSPAFQNFRRLNGMLAGAWTGRDTIPAMLAQGEMILNPMQIQRVRANAGFDVFKTAGVPGYADGGMVQGPAISNGPVNVTVVVTQDATGMWHATAQSDAGQKVIAKVVSNAFANDEIKTKRR